MVHMLAAHITTRSKQQLSIIFTEYYLSIEFCKNHIDVGQLDIPGLEISTQVTCGHYNSLQQSSAASKKIKSGNHPQRTRINTYVHPVVWYIRVYLKENQKWVAVLNGFSSVHVVHAQFCTR